MLHNPGGARNTDPDTSREAAELMPNLRAKNRILVVRVIGKLGAKTDYELASITGFQQNSIGKRRSELRDAGYICDSGVRRPAPSGSPCIVWTLTAKGLALYKELTKETEETEDGV